MKKSLTIYAFAFCAIAIGFQNCKPENNISETPTEKRLELPATALDYNRAVNNFVADAAKFSQLQFTNAITDADGRMTFAPNGTGFGTNQIKNEVATLGRVLFYDKKMSLNNTIACGSCHLQSKAFSDALPFSFGFKGVSTTRNSMAIANPMLTSNLFWDSRSKSLQDMVLKPVQNHIEMGMEDLSFLTKKLRETKYYPALFKKAFGDENVSTDRVNTALMQFMTSMVTHNSKFDEGQKTKFDNFTPLEKMGKDLFFSNRLSCNKCHDGTNFSLADAQTFNNEYSSREVQGTANIGLDMVYKDQGRGEGKFKIPTLRNVELTAPYMHDGRFKTLEDVVEHYNNGIKAHPNLDRNMKDANGAPRRLNLTSVEKTALVSFLKTLTDDKYTNDTKYSDPFLD